MILVTCRQLNQKSNRTVWWKVRQSHLVKCSCDFTKTKSKFSVEKNGPSKPNSSSPPSSTNSHSPTNTISSAPVIQCDSPPDSSTLDQKSNSSAQPNVAANVTGLNSTNPIDKATLIIEDTEDVTSPIIDTAPEQTGSLQKVSAFYSLMWNWCTLKWAKKKSVTCNSDNSAVAYPFYIYILPNGNIQLFSFINLKEKEKNNSRNELLSILMSILTPWHQVFIIYPLFD